MKLSVIIPTYNRRDILFETLSTFFDQDVSAERYEVIIVDDGSDDGTADALTRSRFGDRLTVVRHAHNRGTAAARNSGIERANGDVFLFIDDDIRCSRSLYREHLNAHSENDRTLVFGPVEVCPESADSSATAWTRTFTEARDILLRTSGSSHWVDDIAVNANTSIRRTILEETGPFDPQFGRQRETFELGLRLWQRGIRPLFVPSATCCQIYRKSLEQVVLDDSECYGRNERLMCMKHPWYRGASPLSRWNSGGITRRSVRRWLVRVGGRRLFPLLRTALESQLLQRITPASGRMRAVQLTHGIEMYRAAASAAGSFVSLDREFGRRLPVLMYHHVGPSGESLYPGISISPTEFERHLKLLRSKGYAGITVGQWIAYVRDGLSLPEKPVLLTFDDGFADLHDFAFPLLRKYAFNACVFVVTGQIGGRNEWDVAKGFAPVRLLDTEQIRRAAAEGFEFGSHSETHRDLTQLPEADMEQEIRNSRLHLSQLLDREIHSFAYPYGAVNETVRRVVCESYAAAFSVREDVNDLSTDLCLLGRIDVLPGHTESLLRLRLAFPASRRLKLATGFVRRLTSSRGDFWPRFRAARSARRPAGRKR